jgi:hypothetical protein
MYQSAGVVSPNKMLLAQLESRRRLNERAQGQSIVTTASVVGVNNTDECESLSRQIDHYDSLARQPQSAYMQDWIRQQKTSARDRQFAIRCH